MSARTMLTTLVALTALGFAADAQAHTQANPAADPGVMSVKVSVSDLNLSSEAGARVALRRVTQAARAACGGQPRPIDLERSAQYHDCMNTAVSRAVASLDSPHVTALYAGQGRPARVLAANR